MSNRPRTDPSRSSIGPMSRFGVGRASSALARLLGRASRMQATGRFLRRQLWAWPIIAAMVLGGVGWWVDRSVENAMRQQRINELEVMVESSVNAIKVWMGEQKINVKLIAEDERIRPLVAELLP